MSKGQSRQGKSKKYKTYYSLQFCFISFLYFSTLTNALIDFNRTEFEQHKISELVTVEHRDVCKDGFGLNHVADAGTGTCE